MIWFFAFSTVGVALSAIMALFRRTLGLRWLEWLGGLAIVGLVAGLLIRFGGLSNPDRPEEAGPLRG
ncbi:MAG TPA: hypothetical protein PLP29_03395 [Candidatus Ozemobacteraceae bacterium]|nr:hypothetical protein [Candidatus Ozemobacteraceae bacterium]